jgi:hypothetical protein
MRKYRLLGDYLAKQPETSLSLTFQEIERILGFALPLSAHNHRAWWANSLSHPQASAWLNVGWKVSKVDIEKKTVLLVRPLILSLQEVTDTGESISLIVTNDRDKVVLLLSGPNALATIAYSWQQIIQALIDMKPNMFGNLTNQPDHYIFPEMLAKLGYKVINWDTGESWQHSE